MNICVDIKICPSCLENTYNCNWCGDRCTAEPCGDDDRQVRLTNTPFAYTSALKILMKYMHISSPNIFSTNILRLQKTYE